MSFETLIIWVLVGAIAGIILDTLMGGMRIGTGGAILIGIVGAMISGWAFDAFGIQLLSGLIGNIVEALIGAVVLLLIFGVFRRY
ncbi:MAG: GlsB/YeaQ/YmgE family stress response membrane protein [Anaerolineales bacterium]|jgi:uncharacterized membrane protein YeaQ/YmgE (transglycosylase-associated protein family)